MRREVGAVTGTTRERTRDAACAAPRGALETGGEEHNRAAPRQAQRNDTAGDGCVKDKEHASVASQCGMEPRPQNNHGQTKAGL